MPRLLNAGITSGSRVRLCNATFLSSKGDVKGNAREEMARKVVKMIVKKRIGGRREGGEATNGALLRGPEANEEGEA